MKKILIIEDEIIIREELAMLLTKYDYDPIIMTNFDSILEDVLAVYSDLILLDLTLPKYDGFYLAKKIREQKETPIIILTSKQDDLSELMSIQLGADDFITKPFNSQILLARINAVLTRYQKQSIQNIVQYKTLNYDFHSHIAFVGNAKIELTGNEHLILTLLLSRPKEVISRDELMTHLWTNQEFVDDNTLTVNVNRLRKKLRKIGLEKIIETRRGEGYILV